MFKKISTQHGQAIMTEYIVIFFLAIGAIVAMTVYIQRSLQARIHDARNYMIVEASRAHGNAINYEYEPYYGYVDTNIVRSQNDTTKLLEGGATGIFRKYISDASEVHTVTNQAPPKDAQ